LSPTPYEDSMTLDLFHNSFELGEIDSTGEFRHTVWIDRGGAAERNEPDRMLFAGDSSPGVELNALYPAGTRHLAVRSRHDGADFYSFCRVTLSPVPDRRDPRARTLEFFNDIEPDRAYLNFNCRL
ncbi:MAG: hypothetical protein PHQ65_16295, partial [Bacteroidales bacterium]|nr:hypothetical protein [Bacteroidales bacterium]